MQTPFEEKVYAALINQPYGIPLIPKHENRATTIEVVRQFVSDGTAAKHKIMVECAGNTIITYPQLTVDQLEIWNTQYYSPTRVALRNKK